MTQNQAGTDWENEFDHLFPLRYSSEPKPLVLSCIAHHAAARPSEMKAFIRSLLRTSQARIVEKLEGIRAEHEHTPEYCGNDQLMCKDMTGEVAIYNTGISDAIAIIKGEDKGV